MPACRRLPFHLRLGATIAQTCDASGLGTTMLYALIKDRAFETVQVGRRRIVIVPSFVRYVSPALATTLYENDLASTDDDIAAALEIFARTAALEHHGAAAKRQAADQRDFEEITPPPIDEKKNTPPQRETRPKK